MGAGAPKQEECPPPRLFFIFPQSLDGFTRSGGLLGPGVRPASEPRRSVSPAGPQIPPLRRGRKNLGLCLPGRVPPGDQTKARGPAVSGLRSGCEEGTAPPPPARSRLTYGCEPGVSLSCRERTAEWGSCGVCVGQRLESGRLTVGPTHCLFTWFLKSE